MPKSSQYGSEFSYSKKNRPFVSFVVLIFVGLFFFSGDIKTTHAADSYTKLLLHNDGANGATTFTDSSPSARTVTANGAAKISTDQAKFGGSSGYFNGTTDYLTVPTSTDFNFGTGDFTIDWWEYRTASDNFRSTIARDSTSGFPAFLVGYASSGSLLVYMSTGASWDIASAKSLGTISLNQWNHFAVVRSGTNFYAFKNGVQTDTWTSSASLGNNNNPLSVGKYNANRFFQGYVDEVRITKGLARWTSNFTPPAASYDATSYSLVYTYTAGSNGTLTGTTSQTVSTGSTGTAVTAVPNSGYQFISWNDGSAQNPRTDGNVTQNISVTAIFEQIPDSYTKLLLHGDGNNNSTTFFDSSPTPKTVTPVGNVKISAIQSKFGGSSMYFDGNGSYLSIPDSDDWYFGTGDFTVDYWVYYQKLATDNHIRILGQAVSTSDFWGISHIQSTADTGLTLGSYVSGSTVLNVSQGANSGWVDNQWYHVAVVRNADHFYLFRDGVLLVNTTSTVALNNFATALKIGDLFAQVDYYFKGYIDELRITKGLARWTANFTPPTMAYDSINYTLAYSTGSNGSLSGATSQSVAAGSAGSAVTAVPDSGYQFVSWNDGSTQNPRTDLNVFANKNVTANFTVDSNTKLLLHADGTGNSFVDSSPGVKTINVTGNATQSATQSKFGSKSAYFDNTATYLSVPTSTDFEFAGDYTVDFWTYQSAYAAASKAKTFVAYGKHQSGQQFFSVELLETGNVALYLYDGSAYAYVMSSTNVLPLNAWAHIAAVRSGSNVYLFINGTLNASATYAGSFTPTGKILTIGYSTATGGSAYPMSGYMDELRISKGVARWTSAFTPPISAYGSTTSYNLTYTAGSNGAITGTTSQTVAKGADGTAVTAVPDTGYHFVNWSDSSTANPRTDTNIQGNITVTANFAINTYTLTYTAGSNGTLSGTSPQTVNYNASGTAVTVVPSTGYHFVNWNDSSTQNPRTDTNVSSNLNLTANFAINTYTLTYTAGNNGTISGISPQTVDYAASGTAVTANPSTNYHFVNWSDSSTTNPRTDTNITTNLNLTANFAIDTHVVTFDKNGGDTEASPITRTANHNSTVTLPTAPTKTGYTFVSWNTAANGSGTAFTSSTAVTADLTVYAQWTITGYTLTYAAGSNGTISGSASQSVSSNGNGTAVTAIPATGYHFVNWSDSSTQNPRTDTNIQANLTVTANFAINTYNLNYSAGTGGTISGTAHQTINYNSNGTVITANPNANYHFVNWSDGGTNNPRIDTNVTQNKSVTANFALNGQTIDNPTPEKIAAAYALGAFTLADGTIGTSTTKATTATNLTLQDSGNFSLTIPINTEITNKTVGQPITITDLTTQNITQLIQQTLSSSKAAIKIGILNTPITFSQDVTVNLTVPSSYNNETLTIYSRQDNTNDWTYETTCLVTNATCAFTTRHATEYTANFEVSNSPDPTHVNLDINSTITIDCKDKNTQTNDFITMNPITGTGKSTANGNNDVNCNVITNNSNGYSLSFTSSTPELKNSNNDTIQAYTPATTNTPETWNVPTANSEWGARLESSSTTYDPTTWGSIGTDDYSAKWYQVTNQNNFILANRGTETSQTGDNQIIRFGAEIGANKFQPTGTYTDNVTFTAVTN